MVIAHKRFAVGVLNPFKLEPGLAEEFAAIDNRVFNGGELQKVVFALTRADEQQQYKPNRLHR